MTLVFVQTIICLVALACLSICSYLLITATWNIILLNSWASEHEKVAAASVARGGMQNTLFSSFPTEI